MEVGGEGECGGGKMETTVLEQQQQQKAQNPQILNLKTERKNGKRFETIAEIQKSSTGQLMVIGKTV